MDKIDKFLKRVSGKERKWIKSAFSQIKAGEITGLDVKKLKGHKDIFRVRGGDIRIIYSVDKRGSIFVLKVEYRSETTYKF